MTILYNNLTALRTEILDELSDGQWHPLYKINKKVDKGNHKAKDFKTILNTELDVMVEEGILKAGNNQSYRFFSENLCEWRELSGNPKIEEKQYLPRWFGGILEDDGWELAALKKYDLIHFKADASLTRNHLHSIVGDRLSLIQIDEGLYRVFSNNGENVLQKIRDLKLNSPEYDIRGMRLEKDLRRRDLEDLPPRFIEELCRYYGRFSKILLRPYMSSITKHLPDPDDIQQQIYLWILDAIQRYDDQTSIPFAAYLGTSLKNWVFNLNRKSFGRSVADAELKHSRAITNYKILHGRDPKPEELAAYLGEELTTTKRDAMVINTVVNLRNISTIHTEEADIPIPSLELVEDNLDKLVENTLLTAAIITAVKEDMVAKGTTKDLSALIGIYYGHWGLETSPKKIKMWLRSQKVQEAIKRVLAITAQKIRKHQ